MLQEMNQIDIHHLSQHQLGLKCLKHLFKTVSILKLLPFLPYMCLKCTIDLLDK